jgi:hypothetical protein
MSAAPNNPFVFVVEDGTGLSTANTYVSSADTLAALTARGYTATPTNAEITQWILDAVLYLQLLETDYIGQRLVIPIRNYPDNLIVAGQALSWPRVQLQTISPWSFVYNPNFGPYDPLYSRYNAGTLVPDGVPQQVIDAQNQLVYEQAQNNIMLFQSNQNAQGRVLSEKFDVMQTTYSDKGDASTPSIPRVKALLNDLLVNKRSNFTNFRA